MKSSKKPVSTSSETKKLSLWLKIIVVAILLPPSIHLYANNQSNNNYEAAVSLIDSNFEKLTFNTASYECTPSSGKGYTHNVCRLSFYFPITEDINNNVRANLDSFPWQRDYGLENDDSIYRKSWISERTPLSWSDNFRDTVNAAISRQNNETEDKRFYARYPKVQSDIPLLNQTITCRIITLNKSGVGMCYWDKKDLNNFIFN